MNDLTRQKLCEILAQYSRSVCDEPRRLRALLSGLYPDFKREIHLPSIAVEQRIVAVLLNASAQQARPFSRAGWPGAWWMIWVSRRTRLSGPVLVDSRLVLNETTSMCSARAATDFRWSVISMAEPAPKLIVVSTDGYANSFRDDEGFCQVGNDLLALIRSEGLDAVTASLETWLDEASRHGSGDDVTVALLCRDDLARGVQ